MRSLEEQHVKVRRRERQVGRCGDIVKPSEKHENGGLASLVPDDLGVPAGVERIYLSRTDSGSEGLELRSSTHAEPSPTELAAPKPAALRCVRMRISAARETFSIISVRSASCPGASSYLRIFRALSGSVSPSPNEGHRPATGHAPHA